MSEELELTGGWSTSSVVRVGNTVRRPSRENAAFVRDLLRHLIEVGFDSAPQYLGVDDEGREMFGFVEGDVPENCHDAVWSDTQLEAAARLLRRFHYATTETPLGGRGEVVCHNDFGPWNCVWKDGLPVAIIDFDRAAPGDRLDDLGYALWKFLNLGLIDLDPREQGRRFGAMIDAYGASGRGPELVAAVERAQERMRQLVRTFPEEGRAPALSLLRRERDWLTAHAESLAAQRP
jgi:Ser/Thr protein kinase RdoA (MazF antagonist)